MTIVRPPAESLEAAGLAVADAEEWVASEPGPSAGLADFSVAAGNLSVFLRRGQELAGRLPRARRCTPQELAAREVIAAMTHRARERFLRGYATALYDVVTGNRSRALRLEELLARTAAQVPGLVPAEAEMAAERARMLADKEGVELAHGLLFAHLLALPRAGRHLVESMLRPTPQSLDRLAELRATGSADLGPVRVRRQGRAGILELSNPRYLNAEDDVTLGPAETAVDLILLDPDVEVGVLRGAAVDHRRYPGVRVFGSGVNLTRLYHGRIDFLFFLLRDLGFVHKIYRGVVLAEQDGTGAAEPVAGSDGAIEKLWVAAVERLAVGGACQLLHVVDHVIATRGSRLFLPARTEGIIPGASNLRLPRFVGDRAARQAILSGREWTAGEPDAATLCDEVVADDEMDRAIEARVGALTSSGLVNAAANRRALRAGQEPLDLFREYMAVFAIEQARCHLSPALVSNLERYWNARERSI
jgi:thioesterase DpgC